jgi:hypothetical protein
MSNVILFNDDNQIAIPAAAQRRRAAINEDVQLAAQFATMSIEGKVFTLVKDGQRKQLTKVDDMGEKVPVTYIQAVVLRANVKARVYYAEKYQGEQSAGAKPTCFSHDGIEPDNMSREKQSAKCQLCPHAVWGTGNVEKNEGTACAPNARLAIASPDKPNEAMLLRVPPASIKSFKEAVKLGDARNAPYNSLVMRIMFDSQAPAPKLIFKPVGILTDAAFDVADKMYDNDVVHTIVGVPSTARAAALPAPAPAAENLADELDAALAARQVTQKAAAVDEGEVAAALAASEAQAKAEAAAKAKAEAEAKAKAAAAAKAKREAEAKAAAEAEAAEAAKPAPAAVADSEVGGLLSELDGLLGSLDD